MNTEAAAILLRTVAVAIGLMLLVAGVSKLRHLEEFRGIVQSYRMLPRWLAPIAATLLPPAEIVLGSLLVLGVALRLAGWLSALLFVVFGLAIGVNLLRGRQHIHCGCFRSTLRHSLHWKLVIRSALLAFLSAALAAIPSPWSTQLLLIVVPAGVALFAIHLALDSLWAIEASGRKLFEGHSK